MASRHETRRPRRHVARTDLYHITVDTEGLFHHDCPVLDGGPFRSLGEALGALKSVIQPGLHSTPCAEVYGKLFPLVLPRLPRSGREYHLTLEGGLFNVHPRDIGGPFQSLGEALAALHQGASPPPTAEASLTPASMSESDWKYHLTLKDGLFDVHPPDIGGPFQGLGEALAAVERHQASLTAAPASEVSLAPASATEASLAPAPSVEASLAPAPAAEASLAPAPAAEASLALAPAALPAAEASLALTPVVEASLAMAPAALPASEASLAPARAAEALPLAPAAETSLVLAPAVEASLAPAPAAEASSNSPPAAEEDWMKEEREKGRALKLYLSQLDPDECLRSVMSTLAEMAADSQNDSSSAKQPVEKSWMDTVIENLSPTKTDPDILKAYYRFERLMEKEETIKNGMKWMRKEVLQAFGSYRSSAGYNKNFEYDFVRLDFQCLIYGTFSKSYHHYNFTMRTRLSRSKPWTFQQFFAEVKPTENETKYFCCPLQPGEDGHCFGCRKVGISLRHPESGGYEKGQPGSGFPFDTDSDSDD